eukprot:SAG11_NODE_12404_length_705_cov_1.338284_1_plen_123_part_00
MAPVTTRSAKTSQRTQQEEGSEINPETTNMSNMVQLENLEPHEHTSRQLIISGFVLGDNTEIRMLCDWGASVDFCAPEVYERLRPKPELIPSKIEIVLEGKVLSLEMKSGEPCFAVAMTPPI